MSEELDSDFFREAVAEAKTIRETAIENAKDHLEEAFTPKLQSMLSQTIQQEMEEEEGDDEDNGEEDDEDLELDLTDLEDELEDEDEEDEDEDSEDEEEDEDEEDDEEMDMSDIEDEMEEITDQDELDLGSVMEFLEAATMDDRHDNENTADARSEDNPHRYGDEMLDTGEFEDGYESDNQEPIMDDVTKIAQELEEEAELEEELEDEMVEAFMDLLGEEGGEKDYEDEEDEEMYEVDLNEFGVTDTDRDPMAGLADLSDPYDTETAEGIDDGSGVRVGNEPYDPGAPIGDEDNDMEDLNQPLEEGEDVFDVSSLLEEDDYEETFDLSGLLEDDSSYETSSTVNEERSLRRENQELKEELDKHKQAIKILKEKMNETNLINSKLLFCNRLFKKFEMNDREKMRVIESFDRTSTTREAKLVYTTLAENFSKSSGKQTVEENTNKKQKLVEALEGGRASQKTGGSTTPSDDQKQILNENEGLKDRFQKLADLN